MNLDQKTGIVIILIGLYLFVPPMIILKIKRLRSLFKVNEWDSFDDAFGAWAMVSILCPIVIVVACGLSYFILYALYGAVSCLF